MILTVTPNVALDITYEVERLTPHASHRVVAMRQRAGGKGINVASVLTLLGHDVIATGWAGGSIGEQVRADLDARGIAHDFSASEGEARRTVAVVSREMGDATVFNEAGPQHTAQSWGVLSDHVVTLSRRLGASAVVLSGSLPPGVPVDGYADLVARVHEAGAVVVLDADGEALRSALRAGPDVIKPNREELAAATGIQGVAEGVAALRARGARDLVVSAGPDGLSWHPTDGPAVSGRLDEVLSGNPTGAGDACVAALAAGLGRGLSLDDTLRDAVAWSAAAVLQPVAGAVDPDDVLRLRRQTVVKELP